MFVAKTNEKAVKARGFHYFQQTLCKETDSIFLRFPYKSVPTHPICVSVFSSFTLESGNLQNYAADLYHFFSERILGMPKNSYCFSGKKKSATWSLKFSMAFKFNMSKTWL